MKGALLVAATLAALSLAPSSMEAKERKEMTRVEKVVDTMNRTLELRDKVCPYDSNPSVCIREHDWQVKLWMFESAAGFKRFPHDEATPWLCEGECKTADKHFEYLQKKYSKTTVSSAPTN